MLAAATVIVLLVIIGMFLAMLGASPKTDGEWQSDTEPTEELPVAEAPLH